MLAKRKVCLTAVAVLALVAGAGSAHASARTRRIARGVDARPSSAGSQPGEFVSVATRRAARGGGPSGVSVTSAGA